MTYQSPLRPGDDNLRRTIARTQRRNARRDLRMKARSQNMKLKIAAVTLLLAIGIAGAAANDGTGVFQPGEGPLVTEYATPVASPVACANGAFESVSGALACESPATITDLPSTGSGETAR